MSGGPIGYWKYYVCMYYVNMILEQQMDTNVCMYVCMYTVCILNVCMDMYVYILYVCIYTLCMFVFIY